LNQEGLFMAHLICDLNPVDHITVDTIGPPGQRVFHLQASQGTQVVTLVFEKEQARALAASLSQLLDPMETEHPEDLHAIEAILSTQMSLLYPAEAEFRIGQMGVGFDETSGYVVIIAYQLAAEEDQDIGVARFWATPEQARALARHSWKLAGLSVLSAASR
jgi:uncharacterized repeat protein (TIGR03847 family)